MQTAVPSSQSLGIMSKAVPTLARKGQPEFQMPVAASKAREGSRFSAQTTLKAICEICLLQLSDFLTDGTDPQNKWER